jgi:hypothetical protein
MATADEIRQHAEKALSCVGKDIPGELFAAIAAHAGAMVARQVSDDAVRDAEVGLSRANEAALAVRTQDPSAAARYIDTAQVTLQNARERQRAAILEERLYDGAVRAIEARVELIAATYRRAEGK